MSYCRWSSDDFQCDLYLYEDCDGGWSVNLAGNRLIFPEPLPPAVPFDKDHTREWLERHEIVMDMVKRATREPIDLKHAGESIICETLEDLHALLLDLRAMGYRFPDYVLERVREEMEASNPST